MSGGSRGSVVRSIQTLIDAGTVAGMTDGQLLDQFLERRGPAAEAAFAALVKLHGPMVWSVCRGALTDTHDAEDAFQATFLILVRKAGTVRRRDTLGPWLYGVARRVAVRAKAARRRRREQGGAEMEAAAMPDPDHREVVEALHQELDRLPEKYRAVVVLCHLEGRTQAEAARLLGCPIGTVGVRVSRARDILRDRLTRRGLALPAALAGTVFAPTSASASMVPVALASSTVKAALQVAAGKSLAVGCVSAAVSHLTQGVLNIMTLTKLAIASTCVLAAGIVSTGVGWIAMGDGPAQIQQIQEPAARDIDDPDTNKIQTTALKRDDAAPPEGWGGGGEGYSLIRDPDVRHGGKSSGLIESSGQGNGFGTFTQGIRAETYRGKRLRLSAYVKSSKVMGKAGLWMRIDGKTRSPLGFDNMMNRPIKGTTDWKKYDVVLDVPEDSKDIYFGFLMAGRGRAWVDDITLEPVGKDVKTTGLKIQATNPGNASEFNLPDEPVNVDFEK